MARLRTGGPAPRDELLLLDPADAPRVERCLVSLVADGLAAVRDDGTVDLP